ncbi:hypothetical protein NX722_14875 [Endozoicomonas gorgoniicola]|uniref:Uncharacterized protein n=1 Tax=Endozoicomonas gorgoniicola TaxID=1234144 RepID=A0ABT3MWX7_9GAMM|nr:hypothetical protein [Endozoicomonas gorgoniicola]MCW7553884.1 hypothetical protein [Endozoicomonas gorgoniicola]
MKVFSRAFAAIFIAIPSLILLLSALTVVADENGNEDIATLYHRLITEEFPDLDKAIQSVLSDTSLGQSNQQLNQVTIDVYKNWHGRFPNIKNTPVPEIADITHKAISPVGFEFLLKREVLPNTPDEWNQPDNHRVVSRFLYLLGVAMSENSQLAPVKKRLREFFSCDKDHCSEFAEAEVGNQHDPDNFLFLKFYTACLSSPSNNAQQLTELCQALSQKFVF